jgi:hypothetical protein
VLQITEQPRAVGARCLDADALKRWIQVVVATQPI